MSRPPNSRRYRQQGSDFYVIGEERQFFRDVYHYFLNLPWVFAFLSIALAFFLFNLIFAAVFYECGGGIEGADGSFMDALSFSVQTMATIGYGVMHPVSRGANVAMIIESMFGIVYTALTTGLVFAKFSRPTTRIRYSTSIVITTFEGKRTLMFRVGNRRTNMIVEATIHAVANLTTVTQEGETFYRSTDLKLVRDKQVGMTRGWTVMHVIDEQSPLHGMSGKDFVDAEVEIHVAVQGMDNITMQTVSSTNAYTDKSIRDGHRFVDQLSALPDGAFVVDLTKFDDTVPDSHPRRSAAA